MSKKTIFSFDAALGSKLQEIAVRQKIGKTEVLRRAISVYAYLDNQSKDGNVKIEKADGQKVELVMA